METSRPIRRLGQRRDPEALGPWIALASAMLAGCGVLAVAANAFPNDLILPTLAIACFVLAALVALNGTAFDSRRRSENGPFTYVEVAGLLTFIGVCAASQVEPDQMVRLVEGAHREP